MRSHDRIRDTITSRFLFTKSTNRLSHSLPGSQPPSWNFLPLTTISGKYLSPWPCLIQVEDVMDSKGLLSCRSLRRDGIKPREYCKHRAGRANTRRWRAPRKNWRHHERQVTICQSSLQKQTLSYHREFLMVTCATLTNMHFHMWQNFSLSHHHLGCNALSLGSEFLACILIFERSIRRSSGSYSAGRGRQRFLS